MEITGSLKNLPPWLERFSLEGKNAIIAGAGSGLGSAVAKGFAMSGAKAILADINLPSVQALRDEMAAAGLYADAWKVDVTNTNDVQALVNEVTAAYGHIDVLVNTVGITSRMPTEDFDEDVFDRIIDVNLKGSFLLLKYVGRVMLAQEKGSIINFGSIASVVANPESIAYCCSKSGIAGLTRTAGVEWAKRGVRVNAIVPGTFYTPLLQYCIDQQPGYEKLFLKRYPIGRFGDPEEIVGACVYLASDAASYVTGHLLAVDGGCTVY